MYQLYTLKQVITDPTRRSWAVGILSCVLLFLFPRSWSPYLALWSVHLILLIRESTSRISRTVFLVILLPLLALLLVNLVMFIFL